MSDETRWDRVRELFERVCDLPPPQQRARMEADGVEPDLIEEVLALCNADTVGARVLTPVLGMIGTLAPELPPGHRIGPWRIVSTLAEGGMGRVYLAERDDGQYRQRVAIKLLRNATGADAEQYFIRERQILADLHHPGIARLIDGGVNEDGKPYLVMEYIDGERIDHWCDHHALDLPARLRLFADVCRTVQFAHAHMILHCDLKPSNILVRDGVPVLLDFGIARLIDADAPDTPGGGYMTPRYASPEQRAGQAMSTASDIYSLGLILDELLAPAPADSDADVDGNGHGHATRPTSARAVRDGVRWATRLRGDLDAIVRHATEQSPSDRYASAGLIAEDIDRYFNHLPLRARARSGGIVYRSARLVRRRWPVLVFAVVLAVMAGVFTWRLVEQRDRAIAAERVALVQTEAAEQVIAFLTGIFQQVDPESGANPDITARELLERGREDIDRALVGQPGVHRRMLMVLGDIYDNLGLPVPALTLFRDAQAIEPDRQTPQQIAALRDRVAQSLMRNNEGVPAEAAARAAVEYVQAQRLEPRIEANAWNSLGMILEDNGRFDEARVALERAIALRRAPDIGGSPLSASLHNLSMVARKQDRLGEAETLLREALALSDAAHGETHPRTLNTLAQLTNVLREQGHLVEAEAQLRRVLGIREKLHGMESGVVANTANDLGSLVHDLGRFGDAIALYQRSIDVDERLYGADNAEIVMPLNNMASAYDDRGDWNTALPLFERSLALRIRNHPGDNPAVARAHANLARVLGRLGRHDEARTHWQSAYGMWRRIFKDEPNSALLIVALNGGNLALLRGDHDEAVRLLKEAQALDATLPEVYPMVKANVDCLAARVAQGEGRRDDAVASFDRCIAILAELFPDTHSMPAEVRVERLEALGTVPSRAELDALAGPLEAELVPTHPARQRLARLRARQR